MSSVFHLQKKMRDFQEETSLLYQQGIKKKQIAQYLELHPPVFSSLMNNIIDKISPLKGTEDEISLALEKSFQSVNNISETKLKRNLDGYIEKLKELKTNKPKINNNPVDRLLTIIHSEKNNYLKNLEGCYHCFYISATGYKVKREPLLLKMEENSNVIALKGNKKSLYRYTGFGYLSNKDILTLQLMEEDSLYPDHFLINLYMSPSPKISTLRGISMSMSNNYLPISRKIILLKVNESISIADYNDIETSYYNSVTTSEEYKEIIHYLYGHQSYIECLPLPQQSFDNKDLQKELNIMKTIN